MKHISELLFLEEVDSTNDYLKMVPLKHGLCVVANSQTRGKGRRGKSWISLKGKGLYMSILFGKPENTDCLKLLSIASATAVVRVLRRFKSGFYLKWPNDVYINGKKVAGILPEILRDRVVLGIGINLYHSPQDLSNLDQPATSLLIENVSIGRKSLINLLLRSLDVYFDLLINGEFDVKEYEFFCPVKDKEIVVSSAKGSFEGKCLGIDRDGCLIVDTGTSIKRLISSDVSIRVKDV